MLEMLFDAHHELWGYKILNSIQDEGYSNKC